MADSAIYFGALEGHRGSVTQIATSAQHPEHVLSSSEDKSVIIWELNSHNGKLGVPRHSLLGHKQVVSDVAISSDGQFAISGSYDKTLRLWNLTTGQTTKEFIGHTDDVLSVHFSADNRQILSGSSDETAKLWNTHGFCTYTFDADEGMDRVSCARFLPNLGSPLIVTAGGDGVVRFWDQRIFELMVDHDYHNGYINTVTISSDSTACASGGWDGRAILWDLNLHYVLDDRLAKAEIRSLCFSPTQYWLCIAAGSSIKIWNLEDGGPTGELKPEPIGNNESTGNSELPICNCLAWSADGSTLFAGYSDSRIHVWKFLQSLD